VIEAKEIIGLLEELEKERKRLEGVYEKIRSEVADLVKTDKGRDEFVNKSEFRKKLIGTAQRIPALLSDAATVAFVQQALGEVALKAAKKGGWENYKIWLDAVLDILEEWPLATIPPLLFEYLAKELGRIASYLQPNEQQAEGYAWTATRLWHKRKSKLAENQGLLSRLQSHAERTDASALRSLLHCLPAVTRVSETQTVGDGRRG
jgi:hypothetical protein